MPDLPRDRRAMRDAPNVERLRGEPLRRRPARIDLAGGHHGVGLISGVAVISRAEALGHGYWVDGDMLDRTAEAINGFASGIKVRFTHPGMSSDGLGTMLGRLRNGRVEGDRAIADLHLSPSSRSAPDGDLGAYVASLAETDPDAFGMSIVFSLDIEAMRAHWQENGGESSEFPDETEFSETFVSPDDLNTDNLPHVRLAELYACDVVDSPAANPEGLFARGPAAEAAALLDFAVGRSDQLPATAAFDVHPDRARKFFASWMSERGLLLVPDPGPVEAEVCHDLGQERIEDAMSTRVEPSERDALRAVLDAGGEHAEELLSSIEAREPYSWLAGAAASDVRSALGAVTVNLGMRRAGVVELARTLRIAQLAGYGATVEVAGDDEPAQLDAYDVLINVLSSIPPIEALGADDLAPADPPAAPAGPGNLSPERLAELAAKYPGPFKEN